jgi:hypothetical protein
MAHPDPALDEALCIALGYLEGTGQAEADDTTEHLVAAVVLAGWFEGARHPIRLANFGIIAAEQARKPPEMQTVDLRLLFSRKRSFDC